jgi:hypothetical protein
MARWALTLSAATKDVAPIEDLTHGIGADSVLR